MIKPYTELPRMANESPSADVPLVPNTGIQFIDVPLPLGVMKLTRRWYELPRVEGLAALRPLTDAPDDDSFAYEDGGVTRFVGRDEPGVFALDMKSALLPFLAKWTPLPFLHEDVAGPPGRRRLAQGPQNWARIRIVELNPREADGHTHRAVLAFDTTAAPHTPQAAYLSPWEGEPARFALATRIDEVAWLLDLSWMRSWLADQYRERDTTGQTLAAEAEVGCRHFAAYLTLLAILEESGAFRPIRLIDLAAAEKYANGVVNVDLVLDLGNSRSCGFLVERTPGRGRSVADSYRLALRDLAAPESVSDLPFESRVEFARAAFGRDEASLQAGSKAAFDWPSPVRIGPEAVRLSAMSRGNEGQTGLSSPKRYLWDDKPRLTPWRFNPATDPEGMIRGSYLRYLAEDGSVLSMRNRTGIAMRSMFSRASLFTLFLLEVLLQARSQVNSYAARYGRQDMAAPRRIASLVLTVPPAMPLEEVRMVRERTRAAAFLLRDVTGSKEVMSSEVKLDEATATQIVFLYDQISHAYQGDAPDYLDLAGRLRPGPDGVARPSLRVGSIDVGGGTTDLAIYTYTLNDRVVVPQEEFREGFRVAGDDVLETVLMRHVMPDVSRALVEAGLTRQRARQLLVTLFRVPAGTEPERQARRLTLNHVLAPAALAVLGEYESWDPMLPGSVETRPLGQMLAARAPGLMAVQPETRGRAREPAGLRAAAWLNGRAAEAGAVDFSVENVLLTLDFAAIHETVRQTLQVAIDPLCEIVHRLGCDALLLTGRGVRWPVVSEMVINSLAIEPHRVQAMHRYRVGAWYPFADGTGRIFDPKTTVAVGAMLYRLLHDGQLDNLALADKFGIRSTARYVGLMENDRRIRTPRILFSGFDSDEADERTARLTFSGRSFIGFKQFRAERWPASPLYRMELAAEKAGGVTLPLSLSVRRKFTRRDEGDAMEIEIEEGSVLDGRDRVVLAGTLTRSLQTLPGEEGSHWLDAGQLVTLDAILAALPDS